MNDERLRSRLKKLLALAKRGEGGEKENAQRFLETLLQRHGLTLADLDDEAAPRIEASFNYRNEMERRLLMQVVFMVLNVSKVNYRHIARGRTAIFSLTRAQVAEVQAFYDAYRPELHKTLERAFLAFAHTNRIYGAERDDGSAPPDRPKEELDAIIAMMRGMRPTQVSRALIRCDAEVAPEAAQDRRDRAC
jgi:hypothetical protein